MASTTVDMPPTPRRRPARSGRRGAGPPSPAVSLGRGAAGAAGVRRRPPASSGAGCVRRCWCPAGWSPRRCRSPSGGVVVLAGVGLRRRGRLLVRVLRCGLLGLRRGLLGLRALLAGGGDALRRGCRRPPAGAREALGRRRRAGSRGRRGPRSARRAPPRSRRPRAPPATASRSACSSLARGARQQPAVVGAAAGLRDAAQRGRGDHREDTEGGPAHRSLTVLQALGQRVGQPGGADRRRRARHVVLRAPPLDGARRPCRAAARRRAASPSRGWPTLPGLTSQRAAGQLLARRRRGARGRWPARPRRRTKDSATCEWPIEQQRLGRGVEAQLGQQRAQHVLPDRVARAGVEEADAVLGVLGAQRAPASRGARASITSWVQRAASAAPRENSSSGSSPVTARSWLPARHSAACSRTSAQQSLGSAP